MDRLLKRLAVVTTASMYLVLIMGALVTSSGSAEGCGRSWPLCQNSWLPDLDYHALIELGHRLVSGTAGLLVLVLAVLAWRAFPARSGAVRPLAVTAVFFLVLQAALGALAVLWPQPKLLLAAHFGISLISFASVLLLAVLAHRAGRTAPAPVHPVLRNWTWFTTVFTFVVVYLGAYVRHLRASTACTGWPLCNGEWVPALFGPVGASFLHRAAAALAVLVVLRLAWLAPRAAPDRPDLIRASRLAAVLILLQVASGAIMALGWLNLGSQMLHSALLVAHFGVLSYMCLLVMTNATFPIPAHRL